MCAPCTRVLRLATTGIRGHSTLALKSVRGVSLVEGPTLLVWTVDNTLALVWMCDIPRARRRSEVKVSRHDGLIFLASGIWAWESTRPAGDEGASVEVPPAPMAWTPRSRCGEGEARGPMDMEGAVSKNRVDGCGQAFAKVLEWREFLG